MDVSNSTGEGAGYKVVGGGGIPPIQEKPKKGQEVIEDRGKKFIKIKSLWHEVLAEGDLDPYTYVTVDVPDVPSVEVHFLVKNSKSSVKQEIPAGRCKNVLVALIPNGKTTPKTFLCHRKV